jgi:uncharacterized protein YejL (UPF0352 family)
MLRQRIDQSSKVLEALIVSRHTVSKREQENVRSLLNDVISILNHSSSPNSEEMIVEFLHNILTNTSFSTLVPLFSSQFQSLNDCLKNILYSIDDDIETERIRDLVLKVNSFLLVLNDQELLQNIADFFLESFIHTTNIQYRSTVVSQLMHPLFVKPNSNTLSQEQQRRLQVLKYLAKHSIQSSIRLDCICDLICSYCTIDNLDRNTIMLYYVIKSFLQSLSSHDDTKVEYEEKVFWKLIMNTMFNSNITMSDKNAQQLLQLMNRVIPECLSEQVIHNTIDQRKTISIINSLCTYLNISDTIIQNRKAINSNQTNNHV